MLQVLHEMIKPCQADMVRVLRAHVCTSSCVCVDVIVVFSIRDMLVPGVPTGVWRFEGVQRGVGQSEQELQV